MRKAITLILASIFSLFFIAPSIVNAEGEYHWEYVVTRINKGNTLIYYVDVNPNHVIGPDSNTLVFYMATDNIRDNLRAFFQFSVKFDTNEIRTEEFLLVNTKTGAVVKADNIPTEWEKIKDGSPAQLCMIYLYNKFHEK